MRLIYIFLLLLLIGTSCKNLDTTNENNPDLEGVLSSGGDLDAVLRSAYLSWWRAVHSPQPALSLGLAADNYSMSWDNFGAQRMGMEPRVAYNNRSSEESGYKSIVDIPWQGCLTAVAGANDVLRALDNGVSIDAGGIQDQNIRAAAYLVRGLSWGYLGLLFDQAFMVNETTNLQEPLAFHPYQELISGAVAELEKAIVLADSLETNFIHNYFNGLSLNAEQFKELGHSYTARFLTQWPRTETENAAVDWQAVLEHTEKGLSYHFAPEADGNFWQSYQQYTLEETGLEPFWARVDQRIIAAMDSNQPSRYPEVNALGEAPLANPMASSGDQRLETDFVFLQMQSFSADRGEWHYSHYKHNRNNTEPAYMGNGIAEGPMPVFTLTDNALLKIEALLQLGRVTEALDLLNAGTRSTRGNLPPVSQGEGAKGIEDAIRYERTIELFNTAPMGLWLDRRRWTNREVFDAMTPLGGLQIGTPAQLPVPADELRIQGLDPYNFGGAQDPEGVTPIF